MKTLHWAAVIAITLGSLGSRAQDIQTSGVPTVYHIGAPGLTNPKPLHIEDPEMPAGARSESVSANVSVSLTVDIKGKPQDIHVTRSATDILPAKQRKIALQMDENALEAVRHYRFTPGKIQGKPVPVDLTVVISFRVF